MVPLWFLLTAIETACDDPRGHVTSWENARMPRWSRRAQPAVGIRNQQAAGSNPASGSIVLGHFQGPLHYPTPGLLAFCYHSGRRVD
jgi:hypothetical protein